MSKEKELEKIAKKKEESRKITKEIINFGVTDQQKIDIMYFLSLTLENNNDMKEVSQFLKGYKININKESNENNIAKNNKILLS